MNREKCSCRVWVCTLCTGGDDTAPSRSTRGQQSLPSHSHLPPSYFAVFKELTGCFQRVKLEEEGSVLRIPFMLIARDFCVWLGVAQLPLHNLSQHLWLDLFVMTCVRFCSHTFTTSLSSVLSVRNSSRRIDPFGPCVWGVLSMWQECGSCQWLDCIHRLQYRCESICGNVDDLLREEDRLRSPCFGYPLCIGPFHLLVKWLSRQTKKKRIVVEL